MTCDSELWSGCSCLLINSHRYPRKKMHQGLALSSSHISQRQCGEVSTHEVYEPSSYKMIISKKALCKDNPQTYGRSSKREHGVYTLHNNSFLPWNKVETWRSIFLMNTHRMFDLRTNNDVYGDRSYVPCIGWGTEDSTPEICTALELLVRGWLLAQFNITKKSFGTQRSGTNR